MRDTVYDDALGNWLVHQRAADFYVICDYTIVAAVHLFDKGGGP